IAVAESFFDELDRALVPGLDGDEAWLGHVDRGHLADRRRHAVVVDPDRVEHPGVGAPRTHLAELALERFVRLFDRAFEITQNLSEQGRLFPRPSLAAGPPGGWCGYGYLRRPSLAPGALFSTTAFATASVVLLGAGPRPRLRIRLGPGLRPR